MISQTLPLAEPAAGSSPAAQSPPGWLGGEWSVPGHCSFSTGFGALGMVCWPRIPSLTLCYPSGNWRFELQLFRGTQRGGEDLAYCVVKTVKSEVIAMWDEWDKELEAVKKKKIWHHEWFWLSFFNAWLLFSALLSRMKLS